MQCPHCHSRYVRIIPAHRGDRLWRCLRCDHRWRSDPPPLPVPSAYCPRCGSAERRNSTALGDQHESWLCARCGECWSDGARHLPLPPVVPSDAPPDDDRLEPWMRAFAPKGDADATD